jgi:hypothetical protein
MHHIRPGIKERWNEIPEGQRALVLKALTRKEQAVVMQAIGGGEPEDQHVFDFPGVGKLIATKECGDYLRIDFVPDLEALPKIRRWPATPSLLATVALHHMAQSERMALEDATDEGDEDIDDGPVIIVQDGLHEDPAAYAYIPYPGRCDVHADGLNRVLTVIGARPYRVNSAGKVEYD